MKATSASSSRAFMPKLLLVSLAVLATTFYSCKKSVGTTTGATSKGDLVVGAYSGSFFTSSSSTATPERVTVSKVGDLEYKLTSTASLPSFNFTYDGLTTFFYGADKYRYYVVPKQGLAGLGIDSTDLTFFIASNTISFTVHSNATNLFYTYSGGK